MCAGMMQVSMECSGVVINDVECSAVQCRVTCNGMECSGINNQLNSIQFSSVEFN